MVGPTYHTSLVRHLMVVLIYGSKNGQKALATTLNFQKLKTMKKERKKERGPSLKQPMQK